LDILNFDRAPWSNE